MAPVLLSNVNPDGRSGEIDQERTAPPLAFGITVFIGTPFVKVRELGL